MKSQAMFPIANFSSRNLEMSRNQRPRIRGGAERDRLAFTSWSPLAKTPSPRKTHQV
jgi:hypothetical protein